ncbi:uncharacterized protein G2W53_039189 [Senna tora]|uniref:Uncharacterized protein n=1 Tax=Senna tora TaxID=362788 RepID=A0A834SQ98_9FABA|nr:uncharacterized protein G2W53_039189 [Senna tora]
MEALMVSSEGSNLWTPDLRDWRNDIEAGIWDSKVSKSSSEIATDTSDENRDIGIGESIMASDTMDVYEARLKNSTNTRDGLVVSDRIE